MVVPRWCEVRLVCLRAGLEVAGVGTGVGERTEDDGVVGLEEEREG